VKTPTLLLHGDADNRVPLLQGEEFFRALRHFGVISELVIFPREPHSLRKEPKHQVDVIRLALDWFDRFLEPAATRPRD
jgi:dipeptidyl aminopeptidase/acylaminoacyl peptidase